MEKIPNIHLYGKICKLLVDCPHARYYTGDWNNGRPVIRTVSLSAGDIVKVVMVTRAGHCGITTDLEADVGYMACVTADSLEICLPIFLVIRDTVPGTVYAVDEEICNLMRIHGMMPIKVDKTEAVKLLTTVDEKLGRKWEFQWYNPIIRRSSKAMAERKKKELVKIYTKPYKGW